MHRASGSSIGSLMRELIATPYDLDLYLGTPHRVGPRVARLIWSPDYRISTFLHDDPERRAIVDRMYGTMLTSDDTVDSARYRRAELAAGSGVGGAAGMARLYDALVSGGLVSPGTRAAATATWSYGIDVINDRPLRFGLG